MKSNEPVAVAHLSSAHPPDDIRIFWKQCVTLKQAGYAVTFVCRGGRQPHDQGVRFAHIPNRRRMARLLLSGFDVLFACLKTPAQIVHFHDPELLWVGLALKALGRKVIYDVHEDLPVQIMNKEWIPRGIRGMVAMTCAGLERMASFFLNGIVTSTPHIATRFPPRKTVCIRNLPDLSEFEGKHPARAGVFQVCYVGAIAEIRGVFDAITAFQIFASNRTARFVLAGPASNPEERKRLEQIALDDKRVVWQPWLERPKVISLLHQSALGVVMLHPIKNYLDSYPIKFFEYMAAGLPFLASDFPLWRELAKGGAAGIFTIPKDISAISEAMAWAYENPNKLAEMSKCGRQIALTNFSWKREKNVLLQFYRQILQGRGFDPSSF